ncbi:MAG: hypothetical protein PHN21_03495 [Erysipelotrichaceae bacterium]|nr:hypothetical protein [Erysipelotrichaceae bacterium]
MSEKILLCPMLISTIVIFGVMIWVFGTKITLPKKQINTAIEKMKQKHYDLKKSSHIIIVALVFSLFTYTLVHDLLISLVFYLVGLIVMPYIFYASSRRIYKERIFRNIILYCHNMSMILNQSKNVQHALTAVVDDLDEPLKSDISIIISSLSSSKNEMEEILNVFANKYQYSIIKHLNVIIMYMQYENDNLDVSLLNTFYQDINELSKEVNENMLKRKTLRIQYFMISIGSLAVYWFMYQQLKNVLNITYLDNLTFVNSLYILVTILVVIIIDNYFNNNMTKE